MSVVTLSQLQFAVTSIYHFFFVPLTLGLSVLVAIIETLYLRTGKDVYLRMTKFWGKLFLINFAMGVVTGIVQEFQFGMNWSQYSRFVGDIFGAPLAIEALLAFFLESTFLGLWIFGWDKISKRLHVTAIWLVAIGSNISALWILIANSFMQAPVGYAIGVSGRAVMTDFGALIGNPYVWTQFPHTVLSGFTTGAFFIMGISAFHLVRGRNEDLFSRSFQIATVFGIISVFLVALVGHSQAQRIVEVQPMKMAAVEGLWDSADPASLSIFTILDQKNERDVLQIRIPYLLSILAFNRPTGTVQGIHQLQAAYETKYGPGYYVPSIFASYWGFRVMVGLGLLMLAVAGYALYYVMRSHPLPKVRWLNLFPLAIAFPYLANTSGWILTEMGRQPWIVFGLMKTSDGVSPVINPGMVWASLIGFGLMYSVLLGVDAFLLVRAAKAGPENGPVYAQSPAGEEAYVE
jgi:cytochrome bd ubiquinol oxidase subunit I